MIIDLFYLWNKAWIERYDNGQNCWGYLLIAFCIIFYLGSFYGNIASYSWFSGCSQTVLSTTVTMVLICVATGLIVFGVASGASLMTTAAVSAYATFLNWSGLTSLNEVCNTWFGETSAGYI